jgi:hypothetical protein
MIEIDTGMSASCAALIDEGLELLHLTGMPTLMMRTTVD